MSGDLWHELGVSARLLRLLALAGKPMIVAVGLITMVQIALPPLAVRLSQAIVAGVSVPGSGAVTAILQLGALLFGQQALGLVAEPLWSWLGQVIDGKFRQRAAKLAITPPGISHLDDKRCAEQFSIATTEVQGFTPGRAAMAQVSVIAQFGAGLACAVILMRTSVWLASVVLVLVLVRRGMMRGLFVGLSRHWMHSPALSRQMRYWFGIATTPQAGKEVRVFGLSAWLRSKFTTAMDGQLEPVSAARTRVIIGNWRPLLVGVVAGFVGLLGLFVGLGEPTPAAVTQYITALLGLLALSSDEGVGFPLTYGRQPLIAYTALVERLTAVTAEPTTLPKRSRPPRIRFEDTHFSYSGYERPILNGLDLTIHPGEVVALVGANSAGKTTTTKLLARLYEPTAGRVTADGVDIGTLPVDSWRRRLAVVVQGFVRYDLTLRQNVQLGAPERFGDNTFFDDVSADLDLNDLVASLSNGWDTPLSRERTDGSDLSGGQWQRVALARALFAVRAGRDILILDEPTAHLDAEAEFEVFRKAIAAAKGASVLLISHRLSTVRLADRVAVLHDGRLTEVGSHAELLASEGDYAHMFRVQADQFRDKDNEVLR